MIFATVNQWADHEMLKFAEAIDTFQALHHTKRKIVTKSMLSIEDFLHDHGSDIHLDQSHASHLLLDVSLFTPKMMRFIAHGIRVTVSIFQSAIGGYNWKAERSYDVGWLKTKPQTTPDFWYYDQRAQKLTVLDYKSGVIPVDAKDNNQLMYYAATVFSGERSVTAAQEFELVILQPGHDSRHTITVAELLEWMATAQAAEQRIIDGDLTLQPSDKGCTFCPANPHTRGDKGTPLCPAMMQLLYPSVFDVAIFDGL